MASIQVENKIVRELRIFRGYVLKQDLKSTVQSPSLKELRKDIEKFCAASSEGKKNYEGYEQKHHVTIEFAQLMIANLFLDCKVILITN